MRSLFILLAALALFSVAAIPWALDSEEPAPGRISGAVIGDDGRLAADVAVRLTRFDSRIGALSYVPAATARTCSDGSFAFVGVGGGSYLVDASDSERFVPLPILATVRDGVAVEGVRLGLQRAAAVEGVVRDEGGQPIEGATVAVGDGGFQAGGEDQIEVYDHAIQARVRLGQGLTYPRLPVASARTDAAGRFRIAPVIPGAAVTVRAGGIPRFFDASAGAIAAEGGHSTFLDLALERAGVVEGRILDLRRAPLPGARVELRSLEVIPNLRGWILLPRGELAELSPEGSAVLRADTGGTFRIEGLPEGRYLVLASAPGTARGCSSIIAVTRPARTIKVEVALGPGEPFAGRLVGAPAAALAGATVTALGGETVPAAAVPYLDPLTVPVAADGTFRFAALKKGLVDFRVEGPDLPTHLEPKVLTTARGFVLDLHLDASPVNTMTIPPKIAPGTKVKRR